MIGFSGLHIPQERVAVSASTFSTFFLPAFATYFAMGVLVQRKSTRMMRLALLPFVILCAYRASVLDFSFGSPNYRYNNQGLAICMFTISMRSTAWVLAKKPYKRNISLHNCNTNNQVTDVDDTPLSTAIWNVWDLLINLRGIGWNWPEGLQIPKRSYYETHSTPQFLLATVVKALFYMLAFDAASGTVRHFSSETFGSVEGGTIFDPSLPPLSRYARSTAITFFSGWTAYFVIELEYQIHTLVFVLLFRQGTSLWPPLFDDPWFSTSLTNLWGYRWHQMFRECFISVGSKPFSYLFGRTGGVIGAFLASGALHYVGLNGMDRGGDPVVMFGFFLMQAVGIILEGVWKRCTGVRVDGFLGMLWTWFWILLWANFMVNTWARVGLIGCKYFPDDYRPIVLLGQFLRDYFGLYKFF